MDPIIDPGIDPLQRALMNGLSPGSIPPMNEPPPPEEAFDLQKFIEELNRVPLPSYGDVIDNYHQLQQNYDLNPGWHPGQFQEHPSFEQKLEQYRLRQAQDIWNRDSYTPPAGRPSVYDVLGIPLNVGGNV